VVKDPNELFLIRWDERFLGVARRPNRNELVLAFETEDKAKKVKAEIESPVRKGRKKPIKRARLEIQRVSRQDLEEIGRLSRRTIRVNADRSLIKMAKFLSFYRGGRMA